jgi:acid phosphatase type 7
VANRDRVPWIIVAGHRPFYGSREGQGGWDDHRRAIEPLLAEFNVDFYMAGHVHVFERTHGLYNYTATDLPDADGNYRNLKSPLHLTIGTAGAIVNDRWQEQPAWSAFRVRAYGFAAMTVHNASAIEFVYHSSQGGPDFPRTAQDVQGVTDSFWVFK